MTRGGRQHPVFLLLRTVSGSGRSGLRFPGHTWNSHRERLNSSEAVENWKISFLTAKAGNFSHSCLQPFTMYLWKAFLGLAGHCLRVTLSGDVRDAGVPVNCRVTVLPLLCPPALAGAAPREAPLPVSLAFPDSMPSSLPFVGCFLVVKLI